MPTEHATFGSSTAERTNQCPAWVELSSGVPRRESKAAADGTIIHSICESNLLGEPPPTDGVTQEHLDRADELMTAVIATMDKHAVTEYEPEVRGTVAPDVFGTLDVIALTADGLAILGDIKSGQGYQVDVVDNDQLMFAAWACMQESSMSAELQDCDRFLGVIWQPDRSGEVQTKEWLFTRDMVDAWGEHHMKQIQKARAGGQTPNPGKWCAFCPAAFKCPAKTGAALQALQFTPDDLEKIATAMDMVDDLKAWCADVEKAAYAALEVGQPVTGWKLVAKRATRKWRDEQEAIRVLRRPLGGVKRITTQKLLGIGAIEKMIKENKLGITLDDLTIAESTGTTLAPESDKREAVLSTTAFAAALASIQ